MKGNELVLANDDLRQLDLDLTDRRCVLLASLRGPAAAASNQMSASPAWQLWTPQHLNRKGALLLVPLQPCHRILFPVSK